MSALAIKATSAKGKQPQRVPRCRFTREQLLKSLEIIGTIPAPLPPELPPSPPASRSASPAATSASTSSSSKRKLDSGNRSDNGDSAKRLKPAKHHQPVPTPAASPYMSAGSSTLVSECEAGEVLEEASSTTTTAAQARNTTPGGSALAPLPTPYMPVRRPRRGKGTVQYFSELHDKYHSLGRKFKYSGDARFWSTYPSSHKNFHPLRNPPALGTPYHTHGGLMSRLELVEALICFTYSQWCQDYAKNWCSEWSWSTIFSFLTWCKQKWQSENAIGVREKAFIGLIHMIEACIHARRAHYAIKTHLLQDLKETVKMFPRPGDSKNPGSSVNGVGTGSLPSPAGTLNSLSANSTPTNPNNGTPKESSPSSGGNSAHERNHDRHAVAGPSTQLPAPVPVPTVPVQLETSVRQSLLWDLHDTLTNQNTSGIMMQASQQTLSLPILREHFPRTFGRMMFSTLSPNDEHEPDMEDDEGELFWPGQCVTGQGLGWVCLMGRAMVREFGKEVGYRGIGGIVPKPDADERRAGQRS